ncbi:hypothetical protein [Polluticaenibacter yanchengensis]|uniref:Uncharacterized protein n=1 Tax=Polluticaenibacter yanchengensis TaxID=3014562 RepID=A0ABT4UIP3_9BACT|nr:hypothetical protein [Chitinophagaceae bacterium LY-5]
MLQIQAAQAQAEISRSLMDYGILGTFTLILLFFLWYQEKNRRDRERDQNLRIDKLEKNIEAINSKNEEFLKEEHKKAIEVISKNTEILHQISRKLNN